MISKGPTTRLGGVGLALLCALVFGACRSSAHPPNVLVILIDTLRADRLGCYGNHAGLTPFIDSFADRATVFRNVYAASSWTAPSVASLFTSRYPSQHGVVSVVTKLDQQELTFPEVLSGAGYRAGAVVANDVVAARIGYDQGFELFRNVEPNAVPVRTHGLEWLDSVRDGAAPIFLYLHFMDPHWPYTPPQEYVDRFVAPNLDAAAEMRKMSRKVNLAFTEQYVSGASDAHRQFTCAEIGLLESLYNAEVAAMDAQLAQLFSELESRHFLDDTIVVLTSDHGEEFFEHGSLWHAYTLYEESIRVPLLVRLPGQTRGRVVDQPVSLLDVAPSLLRLLGIAIPARFEGVPFVDLLGGYWWPAPVERWRRWTKDAAMFAELEGESTRQPQLRLHSAALVERAHKVLLRSHGAPEAYDLARDPHEEHRLDASGPTPGPQLLADLQAVQSALTQAHSTHETVALDAATLERLKALGYGLADGSKPVEVAPETEKGAKAETATAKQQPAPHTGDSPTRRDLCQPAPEPAQSVTPEPLGNRSFF